MEHLSDEWITAFDDVVQHHEGLRAATADHHLVIQFSVAPSVVDGPGDTVDYAVVLDHGDNHVVAGTHPAPDITLRTDRRTAAAIAGHHESAQSAFMAGRLRLGGDIRVLIANQQVLAGIDDCAAGLRSVTDAGAPGPARA